ncbi:MAG: hypothetical protein NT150_14745 [Bacteroidetes bacterium]|nr:hypothetical protein [Bacteroidota bacterium]
MRFLFGILISLSFTASAQFYNGTQMEFGKNRVQYNDFLWSYYRYTKFDLYFYTEGKELADYTAIAANSAVNEMEDFFDYSIQNKFEIVIYNSFQRYMQSNLGNISENRQDMGGISRIEGNKLFVYFNGSHNDLMKSLRAGITSIIINKLVYGENLSEMVKSSTVGPLPNWYYLGLVSFLTENENTILTNKLKDALDQKKLTNFNRLTGEEARMAGHSIWQYIVDTYGWDNVTRLLYMTKVAHSADNAFIFILGKTTENLLNDWREAKIKAFAEIAVGKNLPENQFALPIKIKKRRVYSQLKASPDSKNIAYTTNESGKVKVWLYNSELKKSKRIFKKGHALDLPVDYNYPLLAWHPSGEILSVFFESKGQIQWWLYSLKEKKFVKNKIFHFEQLLDAEYSTDGKKIVFSAAYMGKTDIYVYDVQSNFQERITDDFFDDIHPQFIKGSTQIVFSSNRDNDTLSAAGAKNILYGEHFDLFVYDYAAKKTQRFENQILKRITATPDADELYASELNKDEIIYLSDENGIYNSYIAHFDSAITHIDTSTHYRYFAHNAPASNYIRNVNFIYCNAKSTNVTEVVRYNGKDYLMVLPKNEIHAGKKFTLTGTYIKKEDVQENIDTSALSQKTDRYKYDDRDIEKFKNDSDFININNYVFESDKNEKSTQKKEEKTIVEPEKKRAPFAVKYNQSPAALKAKEWMYEPAFQADYAVVELNNNYINPIYQTYTGGATFNNPGISPLMKFGTADLLEDYFIVGGFRLSGMRNNEAFLSFENRKKQLDQQYVFYRRVNEFPNNSNNGLFQNSIYEATYKASWPFSVVNRLAGSGTLRYDDLEALSTELQSLKTPATRTYRTVLRGEYVFDATRERDLNIRYGSRFKVFGEYFQQINNINKNTFVLGADYRRYISIYKNLIFAGRVAGSISGGSERLVYYLGGNDGWLSPKFNPEPVSKLGSGQEYAFQTLACHMRGFIQNVRNGSNFAVLNAEIRWPIVKHFYTKPLTSDFIKNIQVIGFFDAGTAWSGASPFSESNSLNNQTIIIGSPTNYTGVISLKSQRDPIVGGYGFGLRTLLWGYFIRADWAWGIEDGTFKKDKIFYFSVNYDF